MLLSILMMFATAQAAEPAQVDAPTADIPIEAAAMQRALSSRHAVPCAEIEATSQTPRETLIWVVENTKYPAYAGMRAAQCLIDSHAEASQPDFERWASEQAYRGLARMMLIQIDALPEPVALAVAKKAMEHYPDKELVKAKLSKSTRPAVVAVGGPPASLETP